MPDLEANIWQVFRDRGVLVYGLHGDDQPDIVADFVEQTGVTFPIHFTTTINAFDFTTVGYPFPRQVIIGKDRRVRELRNHLDIASLQQLLDALLDE